MQIASCIPHVRQVRYFGANLFARTGTLPQGIELIEFVNFVKGCESAKSLELIEFVELVEFIGYGPSDATRA